MTPFSSPQNVEVSSTHMVLLDLTSQHSRACVREPRTTRFNPSTTSSRWSTLLGIVNARYARTLFDHNSAGISV